MTTFRRIVCLAAVVAGVSFSASAKTCTWINTETSAAQSWSEPANWQGGQVPAAGDDVAIGCAANINFAGATIGNLVHTSGALELRAARGTPLTLMGDFITTGASVNTWAEIYLPEGEHMISNACDIVLRENQRIYGEGGIVKRGSKDVTFTGWERNLSVDILGPLKIYSGGFTQGYYTKLPNVTELLVDGSAARLNFSYQGGDYMNQNVAITIRNGAKANFVQGYTHHVKTLSIEGKDCVAGNWYPVNTGALKWHMDVSLTGNSAGCLAVAEGPAEGGWTGIDPEHPWSGRVATWIGGGKTTGKNDPTNWKDGIIVGTLDDLVIEGSGAPSSFDVMNFRDVTVKADWGLNETITILGDVHLDGGSMSGGWTYYNFTKGDHVIDGTGDVSFANKSCFQGKGNIIWRSTGAIRWPQYYNGGGNTFTGSFRMEAGSIVQDCGCSGGDVPFGGTTNVVFTGEGVVAKFLQSPFNTNAWVTVEKGAKLRLTVASTNVIQHLMMDEHEGRAGRTYGSSASKARHHDDVHFVGTGVFRPWEDLSGKEPLVDDVGLVIAPIGKQYTDLVHPCEPVPVVMDTATGEEVDSNCYEISYSDNIQAGIATVHVLGTEGIYEDANADQTFVIEKDPNLRETCTWINDDASVVQTWDEPSNWKDGKVPGAGDHVLIEGDAKINFAGATIGNLVHTSGALELRAARGTPLTLMGDFITTGASVNTWAEIYLPEGEHMISNACDIVLRENQRIYGEGGIVKRGSKDVTFTGWERNLSVDILGPLKIYSGGFTQGYYTKLPNVTELLVDGSAARLNFSYQGGDYMNQNVAITIRNGAKANFVQGYTHHVKTLSIEGKDCVAGNWYPVNTGALKWHMDVSLTGNSAGCLAVAEGPAEGGWTGIDPEHPWSGRVATWIGGGKTTGKNDPTNWKDGIIVGTLDDLVIEGSGAPSSFDVMNFRDVTVKADWGLNETITILGDVHLDGGSMSGGWTYYNFTKGDHVIDGTGDVSFANKSCFQGKGNIIWRSTGAIRWPQYYNGGGNTFTGSFRMEAGSIVQDCGCSGGDVPFGGTTNVVFTGEGVVAKFLQSPFNADAWVTVEKGAKLRLNGTFENDIKHLVLDGNDRSPRTYGGVSSPAVRKLSKYFTSNAGDKGVLNVTEGHEPGMMLLVR